MSLAPRVSRLPHATSTKPCVHPSILIGWIPAILIGGALGAVQVAGLPMFVAKNEDEIASLSATVDKMLDEVLAAIRTEDNGVHVQVCDQSDSRLSICMCCE